MYLEMSVFGFTIDSLANRPVVILKDAIGNNTVPIWLNAGEALSIAAELILWDSTARSGRKDLMTLLMNNTETEIGSISIEGGDDGVFTASVRFNRSGEELSVAVRPCEAIIAALKFKLPIMMAEDVLTISCGKIWLDQAAVLATLREPTRLPKDGGIGFCFSVGFRSCVYGGRQFQFSDKQARAVEALHKARKEGLPGLQQSELKGLVNTSQRMAQLFAKNAAYGTLIKNDGNGLYSLDL